jgi:hypothetical protein
MDRTSELLGKDMTVLSVLEENVPVKETVLSWGGQFGGEHAAVSDTCTPDLMNTSEW